MMEFAGKVAIVTGASSGMGEAAARLLCARGARVLLVGTNPDRLGALCEELGPQARACVADLGDQRQAEAIIPAALEAFGCIDILVNNAGIGSIGPAADVSYADWRRVLSVDLDAVFWACRAALLYLVERRGCIVNTASISASAADYGFTAYNVAKAGVVALTRCIAIDYGKVGVRANCVSPGFIATPMNQSVPQPLLDEFTARNPMQRVGRAEEVAEAIAFLASERASFINGHDLVVDGGLSAHTGQPNVPAAIASAMRG